MFLNTSSDRFDGIAIPDGRQAPNLTLTVPPSAGPEEPVVRIFDQEIGGVQ
jgi:hypothetical protein